MKGDNELLKKKKSAFEKDMVVHVCTHRTSEMEAKGPGIQEHHQLHRVSTSNLGYMRPCCTHAKEKERKFGFLAPLSTCEVS